MFLLYPLTHLVMTWPESIKEKARELARKGMTRTQIALQLNVPAATLSKWVVLLGRQPIKYTEKERHNAMALYEQGLSRQKIARQMGINIKTISGWVPASLYRQPYPTDLRDKARLLAKKGIEKEEIALRINVNYDTVCRWTRDLTNRHSHVNGRYFLVLAELAKNGYVVSGKNDRFLFKFLKKHVPIKSVWLGRSAVYYLEGSEMRAFSAILKRSDLKLNEAKIENLRTAFGLRR